jgi:signal transduction histidine kinase
VLVHRTELLDDPELIEEVGKAARLALDRERLSAELRGQLQALRASRARTVAAGDAERRRLERDLHDGAQQRLVVLSLALRLLCDRVGPGRAERVEAAMAELSAALEDLRELGRGIYPAVLADEGLAAAVEALAEEGTAPVLVGTMPAERAPAPVEAAAYFVVAEMVGRSGGRNVKVSGELRDGRLCVEVAGVVDGDLTDLEDRIGALDGVLTVDHGTVRAEVPCAS